MSALPGWTAADQARLDSDARTRLGCCPVARVASLPQASVKVGHLVEPPFDLVELVVPVMGHVLVAQLDDHLRETADRPHELGGVIVGVSIVF